MNLSENTKKNCLKLLNYLKQNLKKEELEQSLLLSENDNSLIILPRNKVISWQKKVKLDYDAIKKELAQLEANLEPLSLDEQKQIVKDLVNEMLDQGKKEDIEKTFTLYLCYEFTELTAEYERMLSQSYDTKEVGPLYQPPSFMTGYYFYHTKVEKPYPLEEIKELSDTLIKRHQKLQTELKRFFRSKAWFANHFYDAEFYGFSKMKIQSANFDYRVDHEITTANRLLNSLSSLIPAYLEQLMNE